MLLVSLASVNAKCDWSSLKLQQWNERNSYRWYVSGKVLDDTCVDWMFMIYDFQTKKTDTISDTRGVCDVSFNVKGKYKMYLKVWNKCLKCDTALYREVNIVQFPGATVSSTVNASNCKKYKFELSYIKGSSVKDTCMDYYLMFYSGPWMSKMTQGEWDSLTDYQIGMEYDFPDADFLFYTETRIADVEFKNSGRVLMIAQWWNKCISQDTFMFRKLDVCRPKPKCDWSKVSWGKSNTCNVYTFEVAGTVDTCYKHSILIIKKGVTTPSYTGTGRVFRYTFNDTGYYFVKVSIKNACCGGDTLFYDYIHVTCQPTSGIDEIIKEEPKLIRMYDMMGRPVYNARENEITIYLYSDGSTRKVIKK